jgi:dCMP deaminase
MIILVEGADYTGKSTLCAQLSQRLNMPVFKPGESPLLGQEVAQSQAQDSIMMDLIEQVPMDLILDRFFPSEFAYGLAYDRVFDKELIKEFDMRMLFLDVVPVMLLHGKDIPFERDQDGLCDREKIVKVNEAYSKYAHDSNSNWLVLDSRLPTLRMVEQVMLRVIKTRPSKDSIYMEIAREVAKRSTCLSRRNGAVIISVDGHVIATGYNGAPMGMPHQTKCPRLHSKGYSSGACLEDCEDVHSEENAVAQAAKKGTSVAGGTLYTVLSPCHRCFRMLVNAGIKEVVYERPYGDTRALKIYEQAGITMREMT